MKKNSTKLKLRKTRNSELNNLVLNSSFLGPQAENAEWMKRLAAAVFLNWFKWRRSLYPTDGRAITAEEQRSPEFLERRDLIKSALDELTHRFQHEVPSFSPRYIGHMSSEISIPALLGHVVTLLHNPNNISGEVSRVGLEIEAEAIANLIEMVGLDSSTSRGHFTSGGTVANIEGLVRARYRFARWLAVGACERELKLDTPNLFEACHRGWEHYDKMLSKIPGEKLENWNLLYNNPFDVARGYSRHFGCEYRGPVVLATSSKHYSWPKGILLLGLGREAFWPVELDRFGKLSLPALRQQVEKARAENRPILAVVTVAGTTELGDFDPIDEVNAYLQHLKHHEGLHIWHHVDAAYGGFFCSLSKEPSEAVVSGKVVAALSAICEANSLTVDPHKLGYVPYSSGAFITKDRREYHVAPFDAPYIRWEHQGQTAPQTLDGSRSAAGAAATWLTARAIGFNAQGYGKILEKTIETRRRLEEALRKAHSDIRVAPHSETNIVCFTVAKAGEPISLSNERTERICHAFSTERDRPFFVSHTNLKWPAYELYLNEFVSSWGGVRNTNQLTLVRMCMMNPFFDATHTNVRYGDEFLKELLHLLAAS